MCGIAGFVGEGTVADLARMNSAQASRGPDDSGLFHDAGEAVFLGHLRLSIVDLGGGHQPMWTADGGLGVVFNGEIYNHAELRAELAAAGACFQTDHSDTEVLLHAYARWGDDCVSRFNGMWAFVIFDRRRRRLFASRDRFGKKPFYYTERSNFFGFASELRALQAHPRTPAAYSRLALQKYFAYGYIPAPLAAIEGVHKLPGGCNLEFDLATRRLRTWRYWRFELDPDPGLPDVPRPEDHERLLELLDRAVRRRLVADVPIGIFLSGGIDSSAVSVAASRAMGEGRLETFSIGFDDPSFDESVYAREVATQIGSLHHHQVFSDTAAREALPQVIARLDEPMGDNSILPTWFLCRHARTRVTVALGGDGADELFAGYDPFVALKWAGLYSRLVPRPMHRAISFLAARLPVSHRNMSLDFRLKRTLRGLDFPPPLWCPVWMAPLSPADVVELFAAPISADDLFSEAIDAWDRCRQTDPVSRLMQFYSELYLQDDILTKVDRASMAHSLEVRTPFLDIEFVDHVRRLPASWKFNRGRTKHVLKQALASRLPARILNRAKKGFGTPVGGWMREGSLPLPRDIGHGANESFFRQKLAAHLAGSADERAFLWNVLVLQAHR